VIFLNETYYEKYKKINYIGEDEGLTAPEKMKITLKLCTERFKKNDEIKIADIGGVYGSYKFFKKKFPKSEIYSVNIVKEQMNGCEKIIYEDISKGLSLKSNYFDLVFFGDVIEHLIEPDYSIQEIHRIMKKEGILILTTPNLANIVNRFSLLFGFALPNYHPSEKRYGTLFGVKQSSWHKSVFTLGAMKEFIKSHGFKIKKIKGYTYQKNKLIKIINSILPTGMKEGMLIMAVKEVKNK
jgi:SAM-dependent methyltransferase